MKKTYAKYLDLMQNIATEWLRICAASLMRIFAYLAHLNDDLWGVNITINKKINFHLTICFSPHAQVCACYD